MSPTIHFVPQNVPGYGPADRRCFPYSRISGQALRLFPCSSCGNYQTPTHFKILSLTGTSRGMSSVCKAGYRRNPDFPRQNKHGFSRSRNRQNEERDGSETLEESEFFTSKNGPLLSMSSASKFQATAAPGPREKEIVELFRKVQAKLRERAVAEEEKKIESPQGHGKESETVDSLLKLLRKHTTQQGKRTGSGRNFILDQAEQNGGMEEEKSTSSLDSNNSAKDEAHQRESPSFSRPVSNFRRRSPVPKVQFQSNYVSATDTRLDGKRERTHPDPETDEPKLDSEPEPNFPDGVFDGMSEEEPVDIDEGYSDEDVEEHKPILGEELSAMKLPELRALAKSRGLKGFSKLKKHQLVELLVGGST
ncbi:rho-N domain-containing protein 1, chloroplastic [Diospyros lotus]|uniref:rho-N domain-containing protein 1, chloroplastic n=1 Tax=Diospyros lotus TaxID=55363 RepID=UPI002252CF32|nr:rho-N domain-containing protein 1, chloroplastic [Diospyros lotus]